MGRPEWNRRVERERRVLERILALLLAFAALADRAAGLSAAKHMHLLAILGHGEVQARDLMIAMASHPCPGAPVEPATPRSVPADAAMLAASFRMLALALGAMLAQARGRLPCRHASPPAFLLGRRPRRTEDRRAFPALPPPDT